MSEEDGYNQSYDENGSEDIAAEQYSERSTRRSTAQKKQQQQKQMTTLKIKIGDQVEKICKRKRGDSSDEDDEDYQIESSKDKKDKKSKKKSKKKKKTKTSSISENSENDDDLLDAYEAGYETDHQDYCDVCQQGGEIILCDTCPRAYHLVCLDPELEEPPEGKWSCNKCVAENKDRVEPRKKRVAAGQNANRSNSGTTDEENEDDYLQPDPEDSVPNDFHNEFCKVCNDGGELLCCDSCPSAYHTFCLNPPLKDVPEEEWMCPRCSAQPLKGKIQKILTWRWVDPNDDPEKTDDESSEKKEEQPAKSKDEVRRTIKCLKPIREFFVKYQNMSYWHCDWISELQFDVFHNFLYKSYFRKNDMEEPPNPDLETYDAKKRLLQKQREQAALLEDSIDLDAEDGDDGEINAGTGKEARTRK